MDHARMAAAQAVMRIHRGGWANLTAKSALAGMPGDGRDKAFAGALFYGTVERLYTLDAILRPLSKKPLEKLDLEIRAILETGLYQLLYMQVPPSAAVNESVKLAKALRKSSAAGFVNAVLRKAAGTDPGQLPYASEAERVMLHYSVGQPVAKAVMEALPGEYDAFFAASFGESRVALRVNTLRTDAASLLERLAGEGADLDIQPGHLPDCLYLRGAGDITGLAAFQEGLFHVQGEASQLACACVEAAPGQRVLDLCAAPGGKCATLAQAMGGGEGLTACELRENRVPLIYETLSRMGIGGARVLQNDAAEYNPALEGQDRVLCDVPCSGLGVLGKKPDLRYNDGAGFAGLPGLQLRILQTGARYVKQGGRLVYSTCTIRPEENGAVVRAFLAQNPAFSLVSPSEVPRGARLEENMVTILPQETGLDGFFVACLARLW